MYGMAHLDDYPQYDEHRLGNPEFIVEDNNGENYINIITGLTFELEELEFVQ